MPNDFDVVVAGGGTAGIMSALSSSREGLKTAVIERENSPGGMLTMSGLTEMNAAGFNGKPLYSGLEGEIFDAMIRDGHAEYHFAVPMSSNKNVKIDRLRYDPEMLKLLLDDMLAKYGVSMFYESEVTSAEEHEDSCTITTQRHGQSFTLSSKYLIDATGNAELLRLMNQPTEETQDDSRMIATLMFRISNVNIAQLQEVIASGQLQEVIRKGRADGILKGGILAFTPIPGTHDVSLNVTRAKYNHEDVFASSRGISEMRAQILPVFAYVKREVPGLSDAYISGIASYAGVRDARRITGRYRLRLDDLEAMTKFDDYIAWGCYPMDFHDPVTNTVIWKVMPGVYYIPYRSVLPVNLHRTISVGKCLCADNKAFGAVRVMPIMMNAGESCGYIASLAASSSKKLDEVSASEIRSILDARYSTGG